ncbi:MAG: DUF58 domain-containing protein [Thalassobius sp.]|nr:DUF58 domain-containing protein [Thalassovita sp.]
MENYLDPELINSVEGLELLARKTVEGFLAGANRNLRAGQGQEFSQYKSYQPGDDLRQLDWKLLARTSRYYIKESETETNVTITFILDASASMKYEENNLSKLAFSKAIIACLAYLSKKQGDLISLFALNEMELVQLPPKQSTGFFMHFLHELHQVKGMKKWPEQTDNVFLGSRNKGLVICFSDLYENDSEITQLLKNFAATGSEVMLFHVFGKKELSFDYGNTSTFQDLETGELLEVNPKKYKEKYLERMNAFIKDTESTMLENNISYVQVDLQQHPALLLQTYLKRRKAGLP